jgi:xanthine dehydrogenase YagR molybdenum-binding subunit
LIGTGVAASTYPARSMPSTASVALEADRFVVRVTAADIGTGSRTALTQVAADELGVPLERVDVRIGDSDYGPAMVAGGSMGMASWSWAVVKACRQLRAAIIRHEPVPDGGLVAHADTTDDILAQADLVRHSFGAQFAEVRVDIDTGEIRVPRLVGVFAAGRIINAKTARSQLIGGMTMGLSMALFEESLMDAQFGDYLNRRTRRCSHHRRELDRRARRSAQPLGRQRPWRNRHRRHRRSHRQRRLRRHRAPPASPAHQPGTSPHRLTQLTRLESSQSSEAS